MKDYHKVEIPPSIRQELQRFGAGLDVLRNPTTGHLWVTTPGRDPGVTYCILKVTDPPRDQGGEPCMIDMRHVAELHRMDTRQISGSEASRCDKLEAMMLEYDRKNKLGRMLALEDLNGDWDLTMQRRRTWPGFHHGQTRMK